MKTIHTPKNNIINYLNISEQIDTTGFSDLSYFFVNYIDKNKSEINKILDENQFQSLTKDLSFEYQHIDSVWLVKKELLSLIEKYSYYSFINNYKLHNEKKPSVNIREVFATPKNFENSLNDSEYTLIKLIKNPNSKIAWMDIEGQLHCEPFLINGVYAAFHNDKYDLDGFAEELSTRSDIAFITNTGRWAENKATLLFSPLEGNESSIGGIISNMEHHLEEGENPPPENEEMTILYYPNSDNIKMLIEFDPQIHGRTLENTKNQDFFVERYILNNILNGKKFLLNPIEEEKPKRKFKH